MCREVKKKEKKGFWLLSRSNERNATGLILKIIVIFFLRAPLPLQSLAVPLGVGKTYPF